MKLSFGGHWHRYLWLFAAVIAIYVLISYLIFARNLVPNRA